MGTYVSYFIIRFCPLDLAWRRRLVATGPLYYALYGFAALRFIFFLSPYVYLFLYFIIQTQHSGPNAKLHVITIPNTAKKVHMKTILDQSSIAHNEF